MHSPRSWSEIQLQRPMWFSDGVIFFPYEFDFNSDVAVDMSSKQTRYVYVCFHACSQRSFHAGKNHFIVEFEFVFDSSSTSQHDQHLTCSSMCCENLTQDLHEFIGHTALLEFCILRKQSLYEITFYIRLNQKDTHTAQVPQCMYTNRDVQLAPNIHYNHQRHERKDLQKKAAQIVWDRKKSERSTMPTTHRPSSLRQNLMR